jgi:hypothetical protein
MKKPEQIVVARVMWMLGFNTAEIADALGYTEAEIYNASGIWRAP